MKICVSSPSFSLHPTLVSELCARVGTQAEVIWNHSGTRLEGDALVAFLSRADAAIVGLERVNGALLDRVPTLKVVSKYGVGLDNIDLSACEARNVRVGWKGGVNRRSVAEQTLGMMISLSRNLYPTSIQLRSGTWVKNGGRQVSGATIGIIGVGHIGKELVQLLQPFGCRILANDILDQSDYYERHGLIAASKEKIFSESDIVTVHVPLNVKTRHLVSSALLGRMKPSSILINTSRGEIVDTLALKKALAEKQIHAAGLDVFEQEPPNDLEFLGLSNLMPTPHIAGNSQEAILAMGRSAIEELQRLIEDPTAPGVTSLVESS